jgi:threonylcarbamoyladenosine tRNA methylthiotransferase MtaB
LQTVAFYTLGCKVNQYDTQAMLEKFLEAGYEVVPFEEKADVYVINTCTVTGVGDKKSLQMLRRVQRLNPNGEIVLAGCLAQRMGGELTSTGARLILGTQRRAEIVTLLEDAVKRNLKTVAVDSLSTVPYEQLTIRAQEGHTRAVLKIQEGCSRNCTYCIIPSVRGPVRSRPLDEISLEAKRLSEAGFMELVLTGIHLASYGKDFHNGITLLDAIRAVHDIPGIQRIRLGSLEPTVASQGFVDELKKLLKVCPQFHLSLQSGSDSVLIRMARGYSAAQYEKAIGRLRESFPSGSFTTDILTGFPGETEEEFRETIAACRRIGFSRMHVFPYSQRAGTPAARMADQLPRAIKEQRARCLIALGEELAAEYHKSLLQTVQPVLLEEPLPDGRMQGYTPQYVHVKVPGGAQGQIVSVLLTEADEEGMSGILAE